MEQSKLLNTPLCDLTLYKNEFSEEMQQTRNRRVSKRVAYMQSKVKKEVESDISSVEETSEVENETPEKKTKIKIENIKTSKWSDFSDSENESREDKKSDYEKMIQKNRERSLAFLEALKIDEVKESFREGVHSLKQRPKRSLVKRPAPSTPPPRRKSRRLAKMDLDLSEDAIMRRAIDEAEREKEIGTKPEELPKVLKFEEALKGMEMFSNFIQDFSGLNGKEIKSTLEFPSHFKSMNICPAQVAKVVPSRITAIAIHPMSDKIIVSVASKHGHIGFWNMNSDSNPYVFAPHTEGITNLKFNPYDSKQIISSSYDGGLRCGDMEKHVFDEVYGTEYRTWCTYFDTLSKTTFIVAHKDGHVAVVDNRSSKKAVIKKHPCHDYSVKSVSIHPLDRNYFISSSIKGEIKLWDLRKLQEQPVFDVRHHTRSVTSAFFSPVTGSAILSTSLDDSLCIFDSSNLNEGISLKKLIKHNNFTGRWLSTFKATWVPNTDDTFVVGSMLYPRRIEVFNDNGNNIYNFMSEDLSSITSLNTFHPSLPVLAGGNSSGKVFVFTDNV